MVAEQATTKETRGTGVRGRARDPRVHRAVLDAAEAFLVTTPYGSITMEGIAARAGVGKSTVYRWWPTKAHLVLEIVIDRWYEDGDAPDSGDARDDLIAYLGVNVRNQARGTTRLLMQAGSESPAAADEVVDRMADLLERRREIGRTILRRAIASGELPVDADVELLLDIGAGVALQQALTRDAAQLDDVAPVADLILSGSIPTLAPSTRPASAASRTTP